MRRVAEAVVAECGKRSLACKEIPASVVLILRRRHRRGERQREPGEHVEVERAADQKRRRPDKRARDKADNALLERDCSVVGCRLLIQLLGADVQHRLDDRRKLQRRYAFDDNPGKREPAEFL